MAAGANTRSSGRPFGKPGERRSPAEREDVEFGQLPTPWRDLVTVLTNRSSSTATEECVICKRAGVDMILPHPTKKCGFLWTLTPAGLRWLRERRKAASTGDVAKVQQMLADQPPGQLHEQNAVICKLCGDEDSFLKQCEGGFQAEEAAIRAVFMLEE